MRMAPSSSGRYRLERDREAPGRLRQPPPADRRSAQLSPSREQGAELPKSSRVIRRRLPQAAMAHRNSPAITATELTDTPRHVAPNRIVF